MNPALQALIAGFLITFVLQVVTELALGSPGVRPPRRRNPRPILSTGLLLACAAMAMATGDVDMGYPNVPPHGLLWAMGGMALLHIAGLRSDMVGASTRRHFIATVLAALCLVAGGFRAPVLAIPGMGPVELHGLAGAGLTVLWVLLVVSIFEVCALVPLMAGLAALVVGVGVFLPIDSWKTLPGLILAGVLVGSVAGRSLGNTAMARSHPAEKSEILVLGYTAAVASLATYLKSLTAASLLLPVGIATVVVVVLVSQSFDRSLILRASPRE